MAETKRYPSIFNEALGPVTPGPSSSNTAGPFRLAGTCLELFGEPITRAAIRMSSQGAFTFTYFGMRSDLAFIGGLLGREPDHPRFLEAYEDAAAAGVRISYSFVDELPGDPSELVELTLHSSHSGREMTFRGASVGGGGFYLDRVDGYPFYTRGYHHELLIFVDEEEEAACQAAVRSLVPAFEELSVSRGPAGALIDLKLSGPPAELLLEALEKMSGVRQLCACTPRHPVALSKARKPVFESARELLAYAQARDIPAWQAAVDYEVSLSGWSPEEVLAYADRLWERVEASIEGGMKEGNDMQAVVPARAPAVESCYQSGQLIPGGILDRAVPVALAIQEYSNSSGIIVCIPTGGASGIVPAVITALGEEKQLSREDKLRGLMVAGLIGVFMAETDYFGAYGCQAEVGCGVAMAAGALVSMMGGSVSAVCDAATLGLQSLLGLICDSVCGSSQVPCFIRNMTGTATALVCANAAMAGLDALIPFDEMADTLMRVGLALRSARLNTLGANASPTGLRLEEEEIARQKKEADEKLGANRGV